MKVEEVELKHVIVTYKAVSGVSHIKKSICLDVNVKYFLIVCDCNLV